MIDWLNANSGFILALLTAVYVMATIVIAAVGLWANRLTRQYIELAHSLERRRIRPFVVFDLVVDRVELRAELSNIGLTPAFDVVVKMEPRIDRRWGIKRRESPLIHNPIRFLAPGRKLEDHLHGSNAFFTDEQSPREFTGYVVYESIDGEKYKESFHVDLSMHEGMAYVSLPEAERELEKLRKAVESISKSVKSFLQGLERRQGDG